MGPQPLQTRPTPAHRLAQPLRQLSASLHRCPPTLLVALATAILALIATADEFDGPHIQLALLYTLPIALVSWFVNATWGLLFATFGGIIAFAFAFPSFPKPLSTPATAWALSSSVASFAIVAGLILSLRHALDNQRALANTDELTGIPNARAFRAAAERELARSHRNNAPLTALFLDCDNFKAVNDSLGHATGDQLLRTVASTLAQHLRLTDHVARLGGDEFGALLPGLNPDDALDIASKLHHHLNHAMLANHWPVTFSIGVAAYHQPPASVDQLLAHADTLQYQSKARGKNQLSLSRDHPHHTTTSTTSSSASSASSSSSSSYPSSSSSSSSPSSSPASSSSSASTPKPTPQPPLPRLAA
jgi:diguanylate cyclase (GGDEF)-like protein